MQDAHQIVLLVAQKAGFIFCEYFVRIVTLKAKDEHGVYSSNMVRDGLGQAIPDQQVILRV